MKEARSVAGLQDRKPCFDLIEPRRPGRSEMEMDFGMFLEPALVLLMSVQIVEDDVKLAIREPKPDNVRVHSLLQKIS
jgi:hypothetical protein